MTTADDTPLSPAETADRAPRVETNGAEQLDAADPRSQMRRALGKLLSDAGGDPAEQAAALRELYSAGSRMASYQAASLIETRLQTTRGKKVGRVALQQIHDILSGFLHDHILEEIRTAGKDPNPLGPTLFSGYISELIHSSLLGTAPRAGSERFITALDGLCALALMSPRQCGHFLDLAEVSLNVALELYSARLEDEMKGFNRAARHSRRKLTPPPKKRSRLRVIDSNVVRYLQELQQRYRVLREGLSDGAETGAYEHLLRVVEVAEPIPLPGLCARARSEIGLELQPGDPQRGREFLLSSGADFERQAEIYGQYDFQNLRAVELQKAQRIYHGLGEATSLERVQRAMNLAGAPEKK